MMMWIHHLQYANTCLPLIHPLANHHLSLFKWRQFGGTKFAILSESGLSWIVVASLI